MTDLHPSKNEDRLLLSNITTRKVPGPGKNKMALSRKSAFDLERDGSLMIDSILSQDEEVDIVAMLNMANELEGGLKLPSFYTSSQMGGKAQTRRPRSSPPLSPISARAGGPKSAHSLAPRDTAEPMTSLQGNVSDDLLHQITQDKSVITREISPIIFGKLPRPEPETHDRDDIRDGGSYTELKEVVDPVIGEVIDPGAVEHAPETHLRDAESKQNKDGGQKGAEGSNRGGEAGSDADDSSAEDDELIKAEADRVTALIEHYSDPSNVAAKLLEVDSTLMKMDSNSAKLGSTVRELETSLEFSQNKVETLKKENQALKQKMGSIELEDRRTKYQTKSVDDKLDRLETVTKRKNLMFEGIKEQEGRKEDVDKTISDHFDQLSVNTGVNLKACYRVGTFNRSRSRPILVVFEKQADRDLIYSKRTELRRTHDFQRVWINEDLGQASKRKRGLIRMITREAQQQGVDCESGKYALHINKVKYDSNLQELPTQLQPASLKQVQIDKDTLVYQSEFAPFSNFFPCQIHIGQHTFFCLEQAFQFLRAKYLNKPLAATKIYLSRDVRFIKQTGSELGTSDDWENRQFDIMYLCIMRKFQQHPDLRALLLSTGNLLLAEATPDRLWGCGATISSNALLRHDWPGKNKHGEILMTVRGELRRRETK